MMLNPRSTKLRHSLGHFNQSGRPMIPTMSAVQALIKMVLSQNLGLTLGLLSLVSIAGKHLDPSSARSICVRAVNSCSALDRSY